MARLQRFFISGQPHHVIQRGNNRVRTFHDSADYRFYRECLLAAARRFSCDVHAYVLMTNHVHLLTSPADARAISRMMQSVGRRYVRYFNDRHGRTGTLWEGRYRATLVDSQAYLFTCHRYIEANPLRAGLCSTPQEYPWSSYSANALGVTDVLVTPHSLYEALGPSPKARQVSYRSVSQETLSDETITAIREASHFEWVLGDEGFQSAVGRPGRRAAPTRRRRGQLRQSSASGVLD